NCTDRHRRTVQSECAGLVLQQLQGHAAGATAFGLDEDGVDVGAGQDYGEESSSRSAHGRRSYRVANSAERRNCIKRIATGQVGVAEADLLSCRASERRGIGLPGKVDRGGHRRTANAQTVDNYGAQQLKGHTSSIGAVGYDE